MGAVDLIVGAGWKLAPRGVNHTLAHESHARKEAGTNSASLRTRQSWVQHPNLGRVHFESFLKHVFAGQKSLSLSLSAGAETQPYF